MAWNSGKTGSNPGSFRASGHPQRPSAEFDGSGGYREGGDQDQATDSAAPIWMWVKEDAQLGQFVGAVLAQDADSGLFGQVSYALVQGAPEALQIDPDSGILTVAGSGLDHERETVHQFEIQARDGAGLTSRIRVVLFVVDVNDNRPKFELDEYRVEVSEDAAPGTKLLQVNVSDADADSEFWFDIALPGNELELFAIDRNNGVVKLVG
ncbi:unnamed protein product, partial [Anisakis simplex]|uniref:CA domain-containing protein n=1 Tax=Anisakis simplex TaxID=6269 RepID=A0A0M3KKF0_ANISI